MTETVIYDDSADFFTGVPAITIPREEYDKMISDIRELRWCTESWLAYCITEGHNISAKQTLELLNQTEHYE